MCGSLVGPSIELFNFRRYYHAEQLRKYRQSLYDSHCDVMAARVQACVRGWVCRRHIEEEKFERLYAAIKVQGCIRMKLGKKQARTQRNKLMMVLCVDAGRARTPTPSHRNHPAT